MDNFWNDKEPAPLEYFHGKLMDYFHEWRKTKTETTHVILNGIDFNNIIAKAKMETYAKYPKQVNSNAILKSEI